MQIRTLVAGAALVGATFFATRAVYSQEGGAPGGMSPEDEAMFKKMMELATPGAEHKELAKAAGEWDADVLHWMKPGTEPLKSKGSCSSKLVLGGRFLLSEFKGEMGGMPMEGIAIEGFDNGKKEWFSVWLDSMSTGNMRSTGGAAKDGVRTTVSEQCDWGMGPMSMRIANRMKDADTMNMEMWCLTPAMKDAAGKETPASEMKTMEITYKRKK